jgi:hypothetical protein
MHTLFFYDESARLWRHVPVKGACKLDSMCLDVSFRLPFFLDFSPTKIFNLYHPWSNIDCAPPRPHPS